MSDYSDQARRMAAAAKAAGLIETPEFEEVDEDEQPVSNVVLAVPLDRRLRSLADMSSEELDRAYEQAKRRLVPLTPADDNYQRYHEYLMAVERYLEARAPEPDPVLPDPVPRIGRSEDELPWEQEPGPEEGRFRNAEGLRFRFDGDTPGSD